MTIRELIAAIPDNQLSLLNLAVSETGEILSDRISIDYLIRFKCKFTMNYESKLKIYTNPEELDKTIEHFIIYHCYNTRYNSTDDDFNLMTTWFSQFDRFINIEEFLKDAE